MQHPAMVVAGVWVKNSPQYRLNKAGFAVPLHEEPIKGANKHKYLIYYFLHQFFLEVKSNTNTVIPSISTQSSSQLDPTVPIEPASSAAKDIEFSSVHAQYWIPQYPSYK